MNKVLILGFAALVSAGCGGATSETAATNANAARNNITVQTVSNSTVVSSHSGDAEKPAAPNGTEKSAPPLLPTTANTTATANTTTTAANSNKSTSSPGSPMAQPIDVSQMTAAIEKAEKEYKKNPKAKEDLAKAYFVRATALTGAAQYRQALGDYRKGLKLAPNDEAAKTMHDEILRIFKSINREPPNEGEEPPPLPVN